MKRRNVAGLVLLVFTLGGFAWFLRIGTAPSEAAGTVGENRVALDDLGYGAAFEAEVDKIGQISPPDFARRYGSKLKYLSSLSWDPTTAQYWDRINLNPNQPGLKIRLRGEEERAYRKKQSTPLPANEPILLPLTKGYDFRPTASELAKFKENGFVVSERMGAPSCTDMYYRIYKRDLPVFVSTDSILHAWHRSYDAILLEIETTTLIPALSEALTAMAAKLPDAREAYGTGVCANSLADADYFLAMARSLLTGTTVKTVFGQEERVARTLQACERLQIEEFDLFGRRRDVDFSQFKPRGHYNNSEELQRYFKAMMWCGRTDLRVAGNIEESSPRELASAIVLHDLLRRSGKFERWQQLDQMLQTFIGQPDSMTFAQLDVVLADGGVHSPTDIKDEESLTALQKRICLGRLGAQEIRGDVFTVDDLNPEKFVLPRSFTFLGQRFAVDSWVTAKVVFDDVRWGDSAVIRRVPSSLDVSFAVLANDHTVPTLVERMTNPKSHKFRDGLDYQHNLAAAREVIDAKGPLLWTQNLYTGWLGCLRELSQPTADAKYPEAMRTNAWAMKSLNTQLASWTQLRHDTSLYVKQSYTMVPGCHYPAGFVEPVPHFWASVERMAQQAVAQVEKSPYTSVELQKKHALFLRNFAAKMKTLKAIADKELVQRSLDEEETKFLEDVIEMGHVPFGSGKKPGFVGWYPSLFYSGGEDSTRWDALVADVHTDTPAPEHGDPGCVLHQGVGSVDLLLVAIDNGKDRMVYAGPVLSHYEFELPRTQRKSDSEWKTDLRANRQPPRPEWTRSYLVPELNKDVATYAEERQSPAAAAGLK